MGLVQAGRFKLQGSEVEPEFLLQHFVCASQNILAIGVPLNTQMRGKNVAAARECPGMYVMRVLHAVYALQLSRYFGKLNLFGCSLHEQMGGVPQDAPARPK